MKVYFYLLIFILVAGSFIVSKPLFYIVTADSMLPTLYKGDIVVLMPTSTYSVGDIVTYSLENTFVTHRIVDLFAVNGVYTYRTKGDYNTFTDPGVRSTEAILGKVVFKLAPYDLFGLLSLGIMFRLGFLFGCKLYLLFLAETETICTLI